MGCVAAAAFGISNSQACAAPGTPSKLDYLVLASMADSPHLLAFGGYRSTAQMRAESRPGPKPRDDSDKTAGGGRR